MGIVGSKICNILKDDMEDLFDDNELKCDDCGTTEDVKDTICPYAQEINDEEIGANLCDNCYHERCMDI